jgi:hypothetical protein
MTFFFEMPKREAAPVKLEGSEDIAGAVREKLTDALYEAKSVHGKDRYQVAMEISRLSGQGLEKHTLDSYTSSDSGRRLPVEYLPALMKVTGNYQILELLAEKCGFKLMSPTHVALAELGAASLQIANAKKRTTEIKNALPDGAFDELMKELALKHGGNDE